MYLSYYELNELPFRLTPDPRFLHLAEPHRAVLTSLVEGVLLRKGIIVATGPIGTGKTTLLHAALQLLSGPAIAKSLIASAFILNPLLTRDELLEAILEEFGLTASGTSKPRRLMALHQMLLDIQSKGGTAVLIIDEAHLLTPELLEEVRLLNNADTYHEKLLQVILCGQPELQPLLARPEMAALRQRVASRCALRPLSAAETRTYIAERLHAAALRGPSPFTGPALEEIHQITRGVPRLINLLCDGALTAGHAQDRKQVGPDLVLEAAMSLELVDLPGAPAHPAVRSVTKEGGTARMA
ncbi:MAG: AAA family ATPase [Candidatus Acidiferrales bacterium]